SSVSRWHPLPSMAYFIWLLRSHMPGSTRESDTPSSSRRSQTAMIAALWIVLAIAVFGGPALSPHDPLQTNPYQALNAPDANHLMGTDLLGRDILSRFLWGGQATIGGAVLASFIAILFGALLSLFALLDLRPLDRVTGYALDVMLAFPGLLVALIVA